MAFFAFVQIWRPGELAVMIVRVAIRALREFDPVDGLFAFVDVALGTLHGEVLSFQRVVGGVVILCQECRWLECIHRVAGLALDAFRPLGKLSVVRVQVAIRTFGEGDLLLEIAPLVARPAVHGGVFPEERIFRFE